MRSAAASRKNAAPQPRASARVPAKLQRLRRLRRPRQKPPRPRPSRRPRKSPAPRKLMDLFRRSVALYGRFSQGRREQLQREIIQRRGFVARDLTRRSDVLVVGALATTLIDRGILVSRLDQARARGIPVFGERTFGQILENAAPDATLPLTTALTQSGLAESDATLLAA